MENFYDNLLIELECPICLTYMAPPIRQCTTGHSVCQPCRKRLPACPLCQGAFTEAKNLTLESLARKMHYPCLNQKAGCMVRLALDQRESHERTCQFKGYKCAYSKCTWAGKHEDILEHWAQKKVSSRPYRQTNVCHTKVVKSEAFYVNLLEAYDELFWYKFKSSGGKMFWSIQFIGKPEKANDYYFEIELFKPGQPIRRTLLGEFCQSVELNNDTLFKGGHCVMITLEAVSEYFGEDQLLIYYMRVKQTEPNGEGSSQEFTERKNPKVYKDFRGGKKPNFKPTFKKPHN